ncbi:hypothetical protein [Microbacterium sp.]|uniref:hypothetical protein n=1 Tax=Microbacterium sp. TaxID=51671 RepID=UPI002810E28A|nr:hypothetical protein [Microbacterium sp.]
MNENENARAPRHIDRRTVVKGAAWSVPAIAAAVAMPMATASQSTAQIRIYADCLLSVAGVNIGRGFFVENQGTVAYDGNITVTETIRLSGLAAVAAVALWPILAVQGILGGSTSGVTRGSWSGNILSTTRSRTVTIAGPLAAGGQRSWGIALDAISGVLGVLDLVGLAGITHTAVITSPTGNPPVVKDSDAINWELISTSC